MAYNTTNYYMDNGELHYPGDAKLTQMENIADSTADIVAKLVTDFNTLLKALQDAGLMAGEGGR